MPKVIRRRPAGGKKPNRHASFHAGISAQAPVHPFLAACPIGKLFFAAFVMAAAYAAVVNWENGTNLHYLRLQRTLASLRAEQNAFRLHIAQRHVMDPRLVDESWAGGVAAMLVPAVEAAPTAGSIAAKSVGSVSRR